MTITPQTVLTPRIAHATLRRTTAAALAPPRTGRPGVSPDTALMAIAPQ